jgi:hypothetical protein
MWVMVLNRGRQIVKYVMKCLQAFSVFEETEELNVESTLSIAFFFPFGSLVINVRIISKTKNKKTKKEKMLAPKWKMPCWSILNIVSKQSLLFNCISIRKALRKGATSAQTGRTGHG